MKEATTRLREIVEAASEGPWYQTGAPWFGLADGVLAGSPDGNIAFMVADCDDSLAPREEYEGPFRLGDPEDDAALIVASTRLARAVADPAFVEKVAAICEQAMWSPASGPVNWDAEKVERAKGQARRLAEAVLSLLAAHALGEE